jgi:hypothetical protein
MTKVEFEEFLKSLDFKDPVNTVTDTDGLQATWSQDGHLTSLRFVSKGEVKGWQLNDADHEDLAAVSRLDNLFFTSERQTDEFGNPEETMQQWQRRWITIIVQKAQNQMVCSFCERNSKQVKLMVPGRHGVLICDECVALIGSLISEQQ